MRLHNKGVILVNKKVIGILSAALMAIVSGCGAVSASQKPATHSSHPAANPSRNASSPGAANKLSRNANPLTGRNSSVHGPLAAVMVENSEYGRPQYGLASADVVYETYTEFFYYSRYMLLFWGQAPKIVAPVRSARPYFVSWVHEWKGAAFAHAGSSNPGYVSIAKDHIHNLDLDANAQNLGWRSTSRPAPHNLFANVTSIMAAAKARWGNPKISPHWPFVSHPTAGTPPYQTIRLQWNPRNTIEEWRWNATNQAWTRWVKCPVCPNSTWQQVMGLNSQKPVMANNVVIQYTKQTFLPDPAHTGWINIQTHGQGQALLFLGHRFYKGTWVNKGSGHPTRFMLANGQSAQFNPGKTWIEVVPKAKESVATPFHLSLQ